MGRPQVIFRNNEVFEGDWKRNIFKIPHGLNRIPEYVNTKAEGAGTNFYIVFSDRYLYIVFDNPPNKRFIFSWE